MCLLAAAGLRSLPADPAIFCAAKCGWGGRTRRASCRPSYFLCEKNGRAERDRWAGALARIWWTGVRSANWRSGAGGRLEAGVRRNLSEHGAVGKLIEVDDVGGVAEVLDDFGLRQGRAAVERDAFDRRRFFGGAVGAGGLVDGVAR